MELREMTWALDLIALREATPRTSAPLVVEPPTEPPVEDVTAVVLQYVEPYQEAPKDADWPGFNSLAATARVSYGDWRSQKKCWWCDVVLTRPNPTGTRDPDSRTREHIMPVTFGGHSNDTNLVAACDRCNRERARDLTWVPYAGHRGDKAKMSPSQRIVFQRFRKVAQ